MHKQQAIQEMMLGKKVTHRYFSPDEYITMDKGLIYTEEGYSTTADLFWEDRQGKEWENDWSLFDKDLPSTNKQPTDREKALAWWDSLKDKEMYSIFHEGCTPEEIESLWRKETRPSLKTGMRVKHRYIKGELIIAADEKGPAYTGNEFADNEISLSHAIIEYNTGNLSIVDKQPPVEDKEGELQCTPEEWRVDKQGAFQEENNEHFTCFILSDDGKLCDVYGDTKEEADANAHMLAASKDMYLELSEILKWGKAKNGKFEFTTSIEKLKQLQALLKKANKNYKP
jgi:hypothetical protein